MEPLIIDDPKIIDLAQRAARRRNGSVEEALMEVLSRDVEVPADSVPAVEALVRDHGLTIDTASQLHDDAVLREWTDDQIAQEIAWQQRALRDPDADTRTWPGWLEHMLRINHWPDHIRESFVSAADIEADMYDEYGLPR